MECAAGERTSIASSANNPAAHRRRPLGTLRRRRIQDAIDLPIPILRFTQDKKYDAQQVLAQFARTARDETGPSLSLRASLNALLAELERVIQETLQPEGVRVWLKAESNEKRS